MTRENCKEEKKISSRTTNTCTWIYALLSIIIIHVLIAYVYVHMEKTCDFHKQLISTTNLCAMVRLKNILYNVTIDNWLHDFTSRRVILQQELKIGFRMV